MCGLVTKSCLTLVTLWTIAHQTPLCMGFFRQEYWNALPFPSPKVKVAQSCLTLCDLNSPGQAIGVSSLSFLQGIFPTQGSNTGLPRWRQILHQLSHKGSPLYILCILCSKMKMVWNEILVVVAQFCTIQKTTELSTLNEWILWYVNYISIKLLKKRKT